MYSCPEPPRVYLGGCPEGRILEIKAIIVIDCVSETAEQTSGTAAAKEGVCDQSGMLWEEE